MPIASMSMSATVHMAHEGQSAPNSMMHTNEGKDSDPVMRPQDENTAWRFASSAEIREELAKEFSNEQKEKVWSEAADTVKTYYDELVRRWKEEMDTLLVYAGLSSAVLTAFIVESYKLLQPDSSNATLMVLQQISTQLSGYTLSPPFLNATHATKPVDLAEEPFHVSASAIWLNALWFSSLVFSFASATFALFVKQWIYEAMVTGISRDTARLRQYRLNGLLKWRVGTIVVVLPILLQLASVLFLVGLLVFLWTLHSTVAAIASLLVASFFAFFLCVTVLPVLKGDCPYRSPASFAIYTMLRFARNRILPMIRRPCKVVYRLSLRWKASMNFARSLFDSIGDFGCVAHDNMPTWRGRDHDQIYQHHYALDRAMITSAYSFSADKRILSSMPMIFSDLPASQIGRCFADISSFMALEWGHLPERLHHEDPLSVCALYGLRYMLTTSEKIPGWEADVRLIIRHFFIGDDVSSQMAELACKTLCQLAVTHRGYRRLFGLAYRTLERMYDELGARHTFDTLSHARAMYEIEMAESWDPSLGFVSFRDTTQAIYVLLHCTRAAISGKSQLSPAQADAMLAWGRKELQRLHRWLCDLTWAGLHVGCLGIPGDTVSALAFPHIAAKYLDRNIITPLIALCSVPGGLSLIPLEFVSSVELAWNSARVAYPDTVPSDTDYLWCTGMDCIDTRLAELRAVVDGRPVTSQ